MHDVQLKLRWAERRFQSFQTLLHGFTNSHPYTIVIESDPDTQETLYRLANDLLIPVDLRLIAGDVLQNLRGSLDHLACAL
jgi:hypothetical protein